MSESSDAYNALPFEQRHMLRNLMMENELRLIAAEQRRITKDYRRAITEHQDRAKRIEQELKKSTAEQNNGGSQ